ncbi:hypothetical protein SDC9_204233 [bioreactor metagenome]|uniref:Uncharacterized protein n=1 Tax=bioreactor metagenome TaxID=1076179 RepID=A0A645JAK5_9ZZZZ
MLFELGDDLAAQRLAVGGEAFVVVLGETHGELVGDQSAVAGDDLGLGIELTLQAGGDLHRLHVALERAGEGAADGALQLPLEAVEDSHLQFLPADCTWVSHLRS